MVRTLLMNNFYETSLQISDPKFEFLTKTDLFEKWQCPKKNGNAVFGQKKAPAGWFHSKTKVVNTFPTIPDPIRTKIYLKINIFIANLMNIGDFQLKSLSNLKLLRKPCYEKLARESGLCSPYNTMFHKIGTLRSMPPARAPVPPQPDLRLVISFQYK